MVLIALVETEFVSLLEHDCLAVDDRQMVQVFKEALVIGLLNLDPVWLCGLLKPLLRGGLQEGRASFHDHFCVLPLHNWAR